MFTTTTTTTTTTNTNTTNTHTHTYTHQSTTTGITTDEAVTLRARLSASKGDIEKNVLVTKKLNNKIESLESTITTTTIKLQETENQLIKLKEVQLVGVGVGVV